MEQGGFLRPSHFRPWSWLGDFITKIPPEQKPETLTLPMADTEKQGQGIPMKKYLMPIITGLVVGAMSWGVVGVVSDRFEPFDSEIGFYAGQILLSVVAFYFGYKKTFIEFISYIICAYVGMNIYAYYFGASGQRAWALLGAITTIALVLIPFSLGVLGKIIGLIRYRCR